MEGMFFRDRNEERLLENTELFTVEEIRNIVTSRKNFEYKISKNEKTAYISCIEQEIKLFNRIRSLTHKRNVELHKQIGIRIVKLHTVALSYYKEDLKLWLSYIKFCIQAEFDTLLSDAFSQMLSLHTDKHLWLLAAKWEMNESRNVEKALSYLYRGLYHHPKASSIYIELFKLELNVDKLTSKKRSDESSEMKALKICAIAQKELPGDADLYITLLKLASEYNKATCKLQNDLALYLKKTFVQNEDVWYHLAKRELSGHHLNDNNTYEYIAASASEVRVMNLIRTFQAAVAQVPTESMWATYLNTMMDLCEDKQYSSVDLLTDAFMGACQAAHTADLMSEEHYMIWLERLQDEPTLLHILQEATRRHPTYFQLWVARVRYHMARAEELQVEHVFDEAIDILKDQSIQIWRLKIQYYQLKGSGKIEAVYRAGLHSTATVKQYLTPQFLDWLVLFKTIESVRKEYECLAIEEPWSMEIHKKMVELEAMCPEPSVEHLQLVSKLAREQFGEQTWMNYVQDEINCGLNWHKEVYVKLRNMDVK
ncbi:uncharacterized protein CBL_20611 [Carabus blaptoides fortunei]